MSTKDLGVWKADDCTLVLIDYQDNMFEVIRSETTAEVVETLRPLAPVLELRRQLPVRLVGIVR